MTLRFEQVAALLRQIDAAEGQDVEIQTGDWRIAVTAWPSRPSAAAPAPAPAPKAPAERPRAAAAQATAAPVVVPLRSPAVGVFRPGKVTPGQSVSEGDVLGRIEAHGGGSTDVVAKQGGRLLELVPADGHFVHFGEVIGALDQR